MTRTRLPADPKPERLVAVIDTREQDPADVQPLQSIRGTLATGDYTIQGLEHVIAVERKSLPDLLACIGRERERFDREVQRLLAYPCRALVVESGWMALERGEWRGNIQPSQAIGSCLGWIAAGLPIVMAYDHARAGKFISRILYTAAKRRWREARSLITSVDDQAELERAVS